MAKTRRGGRRNVELSGGNGKVESTTSLISMRESRQKEVDATLSVLRDTYNRFGVTVADDVFVSKLSGAAATSALAYYKDGNIGVNSIHFDMDDMQKTMEHCVKTGFHPKMGGKSGMEAVVAHEVGHLLTGKIAEKLKITGLKKIDRISTMIVNEAKKNSNAKGIVIMGGKISKYATTSNAEAVAEAYSDVYCNGSKATKESKAIVKVLKDYLK